MQNYIVIRGTPAEIFEVTEMIAKLDNAAQLDPDRTRTNTRIIKMDPGKRDELLDSAEDYLRATGKKNPIKLIMPEDRKRRRRFGAPGSDSREPRGSDVQEMLPPRSTQSGKTTGSIQEHRPAKRQQSQ